MLLIVPKIFNYYKNRVTGMGLFLSLFLNQLRGGLLSHFFSLFFSILFTLFLSAGCSSLDSPVTRAANEIKEQTHQRVFFVEYNELWRAAQVVLKYPMALNNIDEGILETEWIHGADGFLPAHNKSATLDYRYKIRLLFAKGNFKSRSSVRVTILKTVETMKSFFSEGRPLASDGIEEMTLFYRMGREVAVAEAIKKAAKK